MKIQKIQQICKNERRITVINTEKGQWICTGYAIYPLLNLPKLTKDNIFILFDLTGEKQEKIYFEEKDALPAELCLEDYERNELAIEPEPYNILRSGTVMIPFVGAKGGYFINKKFLAPFKEPTFFERLSANGRPYLVVKEGLFLVGAIMPIIDKGELAEWLVNTGEGLILNEKTNG